MGTGERLTDAAALLLDEGGEAAVTLRAVALAVGVSHNAPYRHFADRSALLAGVAERDLRVFTRLFESISASDQPAIGKLAAALAEFVAYGEAHPARYRLLFSDPDIASRGGSLEEAAMETFAELAKLVGQAQAEGNLPSIPTLQLTGLIYATVHGLLDFQAGGRMKSEKGFTSVMDGVKTMLRLIAND
ncbi:transcriptional regulator, TetR family [Fulvimarina manganoxydans]|uniref:Transcriptional regulator, TetR family n=2 Tax=Fulvimarina manganoxydans TaxID=937218 RepID=A0A1W2EX99_9HYPH|nr:TetR/AcrR family transcriptional regulator [Fulvimarina manganoxydans]MEE2950952.1 TetR/AcrR family transcriptional regulator [Pseudomonadota bacterium]SMD14317.1 transcriptional regulator, TetR family [Fulvimarina manganoxydans]